MAGFAVLVRARNDLGQFVADDPSTSENEAWMLATETNDTTEAGG